MNVWELISGKQQYRNKPIGFVYLQRRSWVTDTYKLISVDNGKTYELYDLIKDPSEQKNIIENHSEVAAKMIKELNNWLKEIEGERAVIEASWK
ncbi:DUF4976 domain-containing protein [Niabella ginsengisoli]|uniref:DUF4976 domain-containing protein n=2 Tax=Niabella ginsengisoli TaxID=522298 RepID=A0ABS9SGQ0_9BACT|nr:sulfatase/phosphatase domain-containing protein [Niabella ginsengisoli]MCH5597505.1 DUF4976 domain-containing protein [Niabella ginsengisoli]